MSFLDLTNVTVKEHVKKAFKPGRYTVKVIECAAKPTKAAGGKGLNMKLRITGGDFDGWTVYKWFNIENASEKAKNIGLEELKTFMMSAGMTDFKLESPTDLVGKTCDAMIGAEVTEQGENLTIKYFITSKPSEASGSTGLFL